MRQPSPGSPDETLTLQLSPTRQGDRPEASSPGGAVREFDLGEALAAIDEAERRINAGDTAEPAAAFQRLNLDGGPAARLIPAAAQDTTREANRRQLDAVRDANRRQLELARSAAAKLVGVNDGPPPPTDAEIDARRTSEQFAVVRTIKRLDLDGNGSISVNELLSLDNDPNRFRDVPLDILLRAERSVMVVSPQLRARRDKIARSLVRTGGTANDADVAAVVAELGRLPMRLLAAMKNGGLSIVVCRGSVTDYLPDWATREARGHGAGNGWQDLPGGVNGKEVVIATIPDPARPNARVIPRTGSAHGAFSVLFHEIGHAINIHFGEMVGKSATADEATCRALSNPSVAPDSAASNPGRLSYEPAALSSWWRPFLDARGSDANRMLPYYTQGGSGPGAGSDETFAESFARFYAQDGRLQWHWPQLYAFWAGNPLAGRPMRDAARAVASGCGPNVRSRTEEAPTAAKPAAIDPTSPSEDAATSTPVPTDSVAASSDEAVRNEERDLTAAPAVPPTPPAPAPARAPTASAPRYRAPWELAQSEA